MKKHLDKIINYLKAKWQKIGLLAFLFFLLKGLAWLALAYWGLDSFCSSSD